MYKLFLALRYLRTRKISLLSALLVALGVMTLIVVTSIMGGFARDMRARIRGMTAHVTVMPSKISKWRFMDNWEEAAAKIKAVPGVVAVSPQVEWPIMLDNGPKGALLVGIDPAMEREVSGFSGYILDGHPPDFSYPRIPEDRIPVIVGSNVLEPHFNKDVVFVVAGADAREPVVDSLQILNQKDGFAIVTADDEFDGDMAKVADIPEATKWLQGRSVPAVTDEVDVLRRAFKSVAYDPKGERRKVYVIWVSAKPPGADAVRNAWLKLSPEQRKILAVGYNAERFRDESVERSPQTAFVAAFDPGVDPKYGPLKSRLQFGIGSLSVGQRVSMTTITPQALKDRSISGQITPASGRLFSVAAFNSGMNEYDTQIIYAPLDKVQELLGEKGRVNRIRIKVQNYDDTEGMKKKLDAALGGEFDIMTWQDEKSVLLQAVAVERTIMAIVLFFIVIVAAFSIGAILTMLVTEKTRDIGIVRAMGGNVGGIMTIFLVEGTVIGVIGCTLGAAMGALILDNLNPLADWIYAKTGWYPFPKDIYLLDQIPHDVSLPTCVGIIAATLVTCFFAALYPAWKAARLVPVEALRYE